MNIYWAFLSLVAVAVVGLTVVAIICIFWFARKRSWKFRGMLLGLSLLPVVGVFWLLQMMAVYEPDDQQDLAQGFAYELHQPLPLSVYHLQIRRISIGDGLGSYVRFQAPPHVVQELVAPFAPSDKATFERYSKGANQPDWWDPEAHSMTAYYYAENWERGCSTFSFAVIAYAAEEELVFFAHSGS